MSNISGLWMVRSGAFMPLILGKPSLIYILNWQSYFVCLRMLSLNYLCVWEMTFLWHFALYYHSFKSVFRLLVSLQRVMWSRLKTWRYSCFFKGAFCFAVKNTAQILFGQNTANRLVILLDDLGQFFSDFWILEPLGLKLRLRWRCSRRVLYEGFQVLAYLLQAIVTSMPLAGVKGIVEIAINPYIAF